MFAARMNYVCTFCSLRDSLVSVSGMFGGGGRGWGRGGGGVCAVKVADPLCVLSMCLSLNHNGENEQRTVINPMAAESKDQS